MWAVSGNYLTMCEGDWGVQLPVTISGVTFSNNDAVKIVIKKGDTVLITKDYDNISQNTVNLELTEAESALLPVGSYTYSLDWYQDGAFMCNIIPTAAFKVVDKA